MTIEYLPVGIACNLGCTYCYQDPMRDAGNINVPRNWERVKDQLLQHGSDFAVFGGEPLLAPIEHLEEVWKFGYERFGKNGVQTNGSLITDAHIELFKKYQVGVGISIDGPGVLNSARSCGVDTPAATDRTLFAIRRLCDTGIPPSLIITIHPINAGGDRLLELLAWLDSMEKIGIRYINFHILEVEKGKEAMMFSVEENTDVFTRLYLWSKASKMRVEPFCDIRTLLTEIHPNVSCVWNHCDPATTAAVQGIGPDGTRSNCGRTNKDGVNWVKGDTPGFERYLLLRQTPQEVGGCKACRFFIFCKGQCPGTAIDGDWRNRTRDCRTWYALFERIEVDIIRDGLTPISLNCSLKSEIESDLVREWSGENVHHADVPHGDVPHGDSHGDSPHGDGHYDSNVSTGGIPGVWLDEPPKFLTS
jgi:uncharacterized protein